MADVTPYPSTTSSSCTYTSATFLAQLAETEVTVGRACNQLVRAHWGVVETAHLLFENSIDVPNETPAASCDMSHIMLETIAAAVQYLKQLVWEHCERITMLKYTFDRDFVNRLLERITIESVFSLRMETVEDALIKAEDKLEQAASETDHAASFYERFKEENGLLQRNNSEVLDRVG